MLNFCSLLLLPLFTLALAGGEGWLDSNFSVRAVLGEGSYRGFVLWGLLAEGYTILPVSELLLTGEYTINHEGRQCAVQ